MDPTALDYPARFPTALNALPELIESLTFGALHPESIQFAAPKEVLAAAERLSYYRLIGSSAMVADRAPTTLPGALLQGLVDQGLPFCFLVHSDGRELSVSIGQPAEQAAQLARGVSALLGGPDPVVQRVTQTQLDQPCYGCLFGWPSLEKATITGPERAPAVLDVLVDGLFGSPLTFLVFATPEVPDKIRQRIISMREAAEAVDRTYLRSDSQANVDRLALRARALLDRTLRRLQDGLGMGMWRTSVLVGCGDAGARRYALASLASGLCDRNNQIMVPLRGYVCGGDGNGYRVHSNVLTLKELTKLCQLPHRDRLGFAVQKRTSFDVDYPLITEGVKLGAIMDGNRIAGRDLRVPLISLCRHLVIAGHTGSGKSTTIRSILSDLGQRGLPFLILDPVKPAEAEYGQLAARLPNLILLRAGATPTAGSVPLQINPFAFPPGFALFTHIDFLKATFTAAFGLPLPTPHLLESAIYRIYQKRGWDLASAQPRHAGDRLAFPTLSDLLAEIEPVIAEAGYSDEITSNLKGALRTRIASLCQGPKGLTLDSRYGLPDDLLFNSQVVIELRHFGSVDEQAFVMGILLIRLWEYRQRLGIPPDERLRHLLVVEEAHRLLRNTVERGAEDGNMAHQAVQMFVNLIAEVRAYGQGILVAEQLPSNLAPNVIKQVGLKIIHRLTPKEDRDFVGDAMGLTTAQKRALVALRTGEAVIHGEGMDGAVKVAVELLPPVRAADPDSGEWLKRTRRRLGKTRAGQVDREVLRAQWHRWLHTPAVQQAADVVLGSLTYGSSGTGERAALAATIKATIDAAGLDGQGPSAVISDLAIEDALLRRALFNIWNEATFEKANTALDEERPDCGALLRKALAREVGPYRWCAACPAPCRFGYEGWSLGGNPDFLEAMREAVEELVQDFTSDVGTALLSAVEEAIRQCLPGLGKPPRGLGYCAVGHAASRLSLSGSMIIELVECFLRAKGML